uniref:Uncharacterized protein n=1 Tax=Romanomermis culicivorax TaxID=13658 RepID=A0A915IAF5_ROMCU
MLGIKLSGTGVALSDTDIHPVEPVHQLVYVCSDLWLNSMFDE